MTAEPDLVATPDLVRSAQRDIAGAQSLMFSAWKLLQEASATLAEVERRTIPPPPPPKHPGRSAGGLARAAKLSPERRSELARRAALARWQA